MAETQADTIARVTRRANRMRRHAIAMALRAGANGAHVGPGFSMVEITATLYFGNILRYDAARPAWEDRDRFILSKGHGVLGYYTALAEAGFFPLPLLETFETDDSPFAGHPSMHLEIGIEASTGSLGHGLSIGVGIALAARLQKKTFDTYVLLGDGECNEGMVWEAVMTAAQYRLGNLVAVVDRNRLQSDGMSRDIIDMDPVRSKWESFGWVTREVDGHDVAQLLDALHVRNRPTSRPYVVIAHTVKGKGGSIFENNNDWHHNRMTREIAEQAYAELGSPPAEETP